MYDFLAKMDISWGMKFKLQGDVLNNVHEFKYLGVYIDSAMKDDNEMGRRARAIYATGNTIISKFGMCSDRCKILMFKTYCYNVYCMALWCNYRVRSYAKVKIAHNDVFRSLMNVQRSESASTLFANHDTNNLDVNCRVATYSLMERLLGSDNTIIQALCTSEARTHSKLWKCWAVRLGLEWDYLMLRWVWK